MFLEKLNCVESSSLEMQTDMPEMIDCRIAAGDSAEILKQQPIFTVVVIFIEACADTCSF